MTGTLCVFVCINPIMAAINNNKSSRPIDVSERFIEFPSMDSIIVNRNDLHHRRYMLSTGRSKMSSIECWFSVSCQKWWVNRIFRDFADIKCSADYNRRSFGFLFEKWHHLKCGDVRRCVLSLTVAPAVSFRIYLTQGCHKTQLNFIPFRALHVVRPFLRKHEIRCRHNSLHSNGMSNKSWIQINRKINFWRCWPERPTHSESVSVSIPKLNVIATVVWCDSQSHHARNESSVFCLPRLALMSAMISFAGSWKWIDWQRKFHRRAFVRLL